MSLNIIRACTSLQMPPTAKAVLFAMADYADESGYCWPSIPKLCEHTCFSRRSVIDAIAWLESAKVIAADRSNGRHTSYRVTPEFFTKPVQQAHRCSSRTGAAPAQTSAAPALDPCSSRTGPVQEPHSNHQEPPLTTRRAPTKKGADAPSPPEGVDPQTWADWLQLRKAKKAPVTETVIRNATAEAKKAGMSLTRFLEVWCARGSQGLQAEWLKPHERGPPSGRVPVNADFSAKTYDGDSDEDLPSFLRATA
jgi:hypothetical protein